MLPEWRTEVDGDRLYVPIGLLGAVDTREDAARTDAAIKVVRSGERDKARLRSFVC